MKLSPKLFSRIYVASIHPELEETDLRSVFEAFGKIINCQMDRDAISHHHRGYAFIGKFKLSSSYNNYQIFCSISITKYYFSVH